MDKHEQDTAWWDFNSDQPYRLPPEQKPRRSPASIREYSATAVAALALLPLFLWRVFSHRPRPAGLAARDFIGLSVSPDSRFDNANVEMVEELGVRQLLIRVPTWELAELARYRQLAERYPGKGLVINVLQNRRSVLEPESWRDSLKEIFDTFSDLTPYFQIGNAVNRTKWGCFHSGEYLGLLEIAEQVRQEYPQIMLVGSSVIDFEPLYTLRTLFNLRRYRLDVVSSLLYVNRRGSPFSRQFNIFNLDAKIRTIAAIAWLANRSSRRLWITETNWPLLDTKPYTPNSGNPRSTVDERTQAEYLTQYYQIAYRTGLVERVYWWQLINPGYGLVDHRGGKLRKHPAFLALKELIAGALFEAPQARGIIEGSSD